MSNLAFKTNFQDMEIMKGVPLCRNQLESRGLRTPVKKIKSTVQFFGIGIRIFEKIMHAEFKLF